MNSKDSEILHLKPDFTNELLQELLLGSGLLGIAKRLEALTGSAVIIVNPTLKVLAASYPEGTEILEKAEFPEERYQLEIARGKTIYPIIKGKERMGSLIFLDCEKDNLEEVGQQAAMICAVEIAKQNQIIMAEKQYQEAFIYDLLYGNIDSKEGIISRGNIWNWDFRGSHTVIVFEIDDYEQFSMDHHLVEDLQSITRFELESLGIQPILLKKKGEVVAIVGSKEEKDISVKKNIELLAKKVIGKFQDERPQRLVSTGLGRFYLNADEIFRSYQEAKVALELGRIMKIQGTVPSFRDLGLARILYSHDQQELREYYTENLGCLESHTIDQGSELLDNLEKYIIHQCDLKSAADALFLHPNTLRYRLKKVEEILSVNLDDFDTRLNLMVAFKIKYLRKV